MFFFGKSQFWQQVFDFVNLRSVAICCNCASHKVDTFDTEMAFRLSELKTGISDVFKNSPNTDT